MFSRFTKMSMREAKIETKLRCANILCLFLLLLLIANAEPANAQEVSNTLSFTVQPLNMCLQKNETCTLTCTAECGLSTVYYRWYSATDKTGNTKTPITEWSESPELPIEPFTEKGIRYYVCGATIDQEEYVYSDVVAAAYTGLPVLKIETVDHEEPTAEYYKTYTIINATKVPSSMDIINGNGDTIYVSGEYVKKESGLTIKLRGNTSAFTPKKPYKLKLQKKEDLLANLTGRNDKKYKDKDWVLLKDGTSLKTFVGLTVADLAGTPWTPDFAYVNVVMNGIYRGVYMLTEAINQSEKRVNVSDNGYIVEVDTYFFTEPVYFRTNSNRTITFKYPDGDDVEENRDLMTFIKNYMDVVEDKIQEGAYDDYIDTESFARWQLIHDILGSNDYRGSNIYMTKYDNTTPDAPYEDGTWSKIAMSTPWDFDGIYSMDNSWAKQHNSDRNYSTSLFTNQNSAFFDSYQEQWEDIADDVWSDLSTKLNALKNDIGEEINLSRQLDAVKWNTSYKTVEEDIATAQTWFASRVEWLNTAINGMKKVLLPDFSNLSITPKTYDGTDAVDYSGDIAIKNPTSITEGDDVSLNIISARYNSPNTDAKSIVITYELSGAEKDKYTLLSNQFYPLLDDANAYYNDDISEYMLTSNTEEIPATILPKHYDNLTIALSEKDFVYDGTAKIPAITVENGDTLLPASLYSTVYVNNTNAGTAIVAITDIEKENYTVNGNFTTFNIAPKPINSALIAISDSSFIYDGSEKTPTVTLKDGEIAIPESEYAVSYADNVNAGTASISITNISGNYAISDTNVVFTIAPKLVDTVSIALSESIFIYDGLAKTPTINLKDGETTIPESEYSVAYTDNFNAGTASISITNVSGNYAISDTSIVFTITPRLVDDILITLSDSSFIYDGLEKTPTVILKDGETTIPESEYAVSYADNVNAGTASISITNVSGNYIISDTSIAFTIAPKSVDSTIIALSDSDFIYDGFAKTPTVTLKDGETTIPESEYAVSYADNVNAGTASISITNVSGNYTINDTNVVFTIAPKPIDTVSIALSDSDFIYDGLTKTPTIILKDGETTILESEYSVAYTDNFNAGTASISITNVSGNYAISDTSIVFAITPKLVDSVLIALSESIFIYDGLAKTPTVTLKEGETTIPESEYIVAYADNVNAGTASISITNVSGNYVISDTSATFTIAPKVVDDILIVLSDSCFIYDSVAKTPTVTVKDGETIIPESEYEVAYADNINQGTATVSITDAEGGNYIVNGTTTFDIVYVYNAPSYAWNEDHSTCTATQTGMNDKIPVITETVNSTSDTIYATCETAGSATYTAEFTNDGFEKQETTVIIAALGHKMVVDNVVAPTCTETGLTIGIHCDICHTVFLTQDTIPALNHEFANYIFNNDATTTNDGTETAQCEHGCGITDTRTAQGTKLPDATDVSDNVANEVSIYAYSNTIVVENANDYIYVYNAMGSLISRIAPEAGRTEIQVNGAGVYVVKTGNAAQRVMIND